jgi:hypothetical protein
LPAAAIASLQKSLLPSAKTGPLPIQVLRRLRSADIGAAILPPSTNVPESVSELIGRDLEPNEIIDLSAFRLVALVGAGGIGKTRLGIEVARRLISEIWRWS